MKFTYLASMSVALFLAACGGRVGSSSATPVPTPIVDSPAAEQTCLARDTQHQWSLLAAYDTTVGAIVSWQNSKGIHWPFQDEPAQSSAVVCYFSGSFIVPGLPGASDSTAPIDRLCIVVAADGKYASIRTGSTSSVPLDRPSPVPSASQSG